MTDPLDDPTVVDRHRASLPPADPLAPGSRFGGYEVLDPIGRGGMGTVYRARHLSLDRLVALKVLDLRQHRAADIERFANEARAAARLVHPGIVQIHDVGEVEGRHYLALELVGGIGLDRLIDRERLPPRRALEIVADLADAVHYAHGQGVIHRDLKPSNVLIDERGHPRLVDFGLARRIDTSQQLTESGQTLGTPAYMAPEQVSHETGAIGRPTDVHGLGAVCYELLAGRPPFAGDNLLQMLHQVLHHLPDPPHEILPDVPLEYSQICLKCLAKDPAERYPTARALAIDCRGVLLDQPSAEPAKVERVPRSPRSRRIPAPPRPARAPKVLLAVLLLLGGLLAYHAATRKAPATKPVAPADLDQQYLKAMLAGDLEVAYQLQAKLLAVRPTDWNLRRRRVELAQELKRPADAIAALLALERGDRLSATETRTLLALQLQTGQLNPAKQLVERVFSRDPALWRELCLQVASRLEPQPALQYLDRASARAAHPDLSNQIARRKLAAGQALEAARLWLAIPPELADPQFLIALKQTSRKDFPPELLLQLARHDASFFSFPALAGWLVAKPERVEALGPDLLDKLLFEASRDRKWDALGQAAGEALATRDPARSKRLADQAWKHAMASLEARRYRDAVQHYTRVLALQPRSAAAWYNRGLSYRRLGQDELALADYDQALRIKPGSPYALNNRGVIRLDRGEYPAAIRDFSGAIASSAPKDPSLQRWLGNRGFAYLLADQPDKALPDFKRAAALQPHLLFDLGSALAAAAASRMAATRATLAGVLSRGGGKILVGSGRYRYLLKIATRLIALLPAHPLAYAERGNLHLALLERAKAIRDLERALTLCRGEHDAHRPVVEQALASASNKR